MMFAIALSGLRASETASGAGPAHLVAEAPTRDAEPPETSREWRPDVLFDDEEECPAFFQRDIGKLGNLRVGRSCAEDGLPHAL